MREKAALIGDRTGDRHLVQFNDPQAVEPANPSSGVLRKPDGIARVDAKGLHEGIQDWAVRANDRPALHGKGLDVVDLWLPDRGGRCPAWIALSGRWRDVDHAITRLLINVGAVRSSV